MTVNRTTLLDLPLPVTGTESGTWGDTTNNGLTQYVDIAIAGMSNLTSANFTAGALTIETTEGDSSATNISATSAQYAGFRVSSLAVNSTITVGNTGTSPARSYRLINADATYSLTFKATGQTGVTLLPGQSAVVAFNGTDYVIVGVVGAGSTTDNTVPRFDGTTGEILQSSGVTIDDSNNVSGVAQLNITTLDATNIEVTNIKAKDGTAAATIADSTGVVTVTAAPVMTALTASQAVFTTAGKALTSNAITGTGNVVMSASPTLTGTISAAAATLSGNLTLSGGTANGVLYLDGSKVATSGSALTFDGTLLTRTRQADYSTRFAYDASNYTDIGYFSTNTVAPSNPFWAWFLNGSEAMRLTSTGLGIGTSSPTNALTVGTTSSGKNIAIYSSSNGNNGLLRIFDLGGTERLQLSANSTGEAVYYAPTGSVHAWYVNTERMRLDSSGNLGLGVTPSAWNNIFKAIQVNAQGALMATSASMQMGNNVFYDGAYKFIGTGYANRYYQASGQHVWTVSTASGSVGGLITETTTMTLDASGRLGIGVTNPGSTLAVRGDNGSSTSSILRLRDTNSTARTTRLQFEDYNGTLADGIIDFKVPTAGVASSAILQFGVNSAAMTLDASGNLGVGTTSPGGKLDVYGADVAIYNGYSNGILTVGTNSGVSSALKLQGASYISFTTYGSSWNERARITSGGNLLVGTTVDNDATLAVSTTSGSRKLTKTFTASFTTNPQTRNVSLTINDVIAVSVEITIIGDYANNDYSGAMKQAYGFGTNASGTTLFGSANTSMYSLGNTSTAYAFGAATKPNNTTVNLPITYTGADTNTTLRVVVEIYGNCNAITAISFS